MEGFKKIESRSGNDQFIFETKHCRIGVPHKPHVSREEGGHLVIFTKRTVAERFELTKEEAWDLMWTSICLGKAMTEVLADAGIKLRTINYQDNGNWYFLRGHDKPELHMHLYGRAENTTNQIFGQSLRFPDPNDYASFYERNIPLNEDDIEKITERFEIYYSEALDCSAARD